jgi:plastocyanin
MMEPRFNLFSRPQHFRIAGIFLAMISVTSCGTDSMMAPSLNGCADTDFVDRSAATATRVVSFGGVERSGPFAYAPKCIVVSAGQTVTFRGDFSQHPLAPGSSPSARVTGSTNNPIPRRETTQADVTITFPAAGSFPYFCEYHYAGGMAGVVRVR